jgi:hypothetical protein
MDRPIWGALAGSRALATRDRARARTAVERVARTHFAADWRVTDLAPEALLASFLARFDHSASVRHLLSHRELAREHVGAALEQLVWHFHVGEAGDTIPRKPDPAALLLREPSAAEERRWRLLAHISAEYRADGEPALAETLERVVADDRAVALRRGVLVEPLPPQRERKRERWQYVIHLLDGILGCLPLAERASLIAGLVSDFFGPISSRTVYQRIDKAGRRERARRQLLSQPGERSAS